MDNLCVGCGSRIEIHLKLKNRAKNPAEKVFWTHPLPNSIDT